MVSSGKFLTALITFILLLAVGTLFYIYDGEGTKLPHATDCVANGLSAGSDRFIDSFYTACTTSTTVGYVLRHQQLCLAVLLPGVSCDQSLTFYTFCFLILICCRYGDLHPVGNSQKW